MCAGMLDGIVRPSVGSQCPRVVCLCVCVCVCVRDYFAIVRAEVGGVGHGCWRWHPPSYLPWPMPALAAIPLVRGAAGHARCQWTFQRLRVRARGVIVA